MSVKKKSQRSSGANVSRENARGINQRGSTLSRFFYNEVLSSGGFACVHRCVHKGKGEETEARYNPLRNSAGEGHLLHEDKLMIPCELEFFLSDNKRRKYVTFSFAKVELKDKWPNINRRKRINYFITFFFDYLWINSTTRSFSEIKLRWSIKQKSAENLENCKLFKLKNWTVYSIVSRSTIRPLTIRLSLRNNGETWWVRYHQR